MKLPYLPNTDSDRDIMLKEIGISNVDDLFGDVPRELLNVNFDLPSPLSELELKKELGELSRRNEGSDNYPCFLGAGFYRHFIPGVIGSITGLSNFYTAYTPYQAEASQGTLQAMFEYQSLMCQLTGMEASNAGMYDGSTAATEAALMAARITKRSKVAMLSTVNPRYRKVMETYIPTEVEVMEPASEKLPSDCACLVVQHPNYFGNLEDIGAITQRAHNAGALLCVIFDPISLGMLKAPGDYDADIAVAEGQSLGNPLFFGGPGLGIYTCRKEYIRQMPGRIVGRTADTEGKTGYVLTLATREQHIRRERATSNICTSSALTALAATVYLASMGKQGLRHVAELCYHKAHYAAHEISKLKGYSLVSDQPFFKEFAIRCPLPPQQINDALLKAGIIGGLDISSMLPNGLLLCVTEMNSKQDIDRLVSVLGNLSGESNDE